MTEKHRRFLRAVRAFIPRERVYTDYLRRLAWGTDAGFYRLVPQIVVRAAHEEEIVRIMRAAARLGVPLTFRAAARAFRGRPSAIRCSWWRANIGSVARCFTAAVPCGSSPASWERGSTRC